MKHHMQIWASNSPRLSHVTRSILLNIEAYRATAGCVDHQSSRDLPPKSRLSLLLGDCLKSQHASDASKQAATRLASACAMADASTYKMLLPWLEEMMWRGQKSRTQTLAAAGERAPLTHHTCL